MGILASKLPDSRLHCLLECAPHAWIRLKCLFLDFGELAKFAEADHLGISMILERYQLAHNKFLFRKDSNNTNNYYCGLKRIVSQCFKHKYL